LLKHECQSNEIKKRQDLLVYFFYDNFPAKFNRIGGREANVELAMKCLDYVVHQHLTDAEGDKLLELVREVVVKSNQDSVCPIPMRMKTLRRAFLSKADNFFALKYEKIALLHEYFGNTGMETGRKKKKITIPPKRKAYRTLEDALALLLLKMNPEEMLKEMEPAYTTVNGIKERLYSDFSTGDYPIEIQKEVHSRYLVDFKGKKPLVIFLSIFIDGALLNSTKSRSAIPIVVTVLNDTKKNSTVIAFNVNNVHASSEMLEHVLHQLGITAIGRKADLLKQTLRQLNWDLFYVLFGNFYNRQNAVKGYDVQIGLGRNAEFHRVHFVFANLIGDHPQIHSNSYWNKE